ncbi:MAG TPA: DUF6599 family protein [Armatimonadota bacterium]|nr:DUF6599 family protein [Armatimonadota bacterium]
MSYVKVAAGTLALLVTGVVLSASADAAKRIEWWRTPNTQPVDSTTPDEPVPEGSEENRPAELLEAVATRAELPLVGEVSGATAAALEPPEAGTAPGPPPVPGWAARELFGDYALTAMAAAEYAHPKGQTLRVALYEFASAQDAWGLWSRDRGEKTVYAGQSAAFGPPLRVWEGKYAAVLSMDTADERLDEVRLSKFARSLFALISGSGNPPSITGWLPSALQVPHEVTYFHAQAPFGTGAMALDETTNGAMAQYRVGDDGVPFWGALISYSSHDAALLGWRRFVASQLGGDPDEGTEGARRTGLSGGWGGVKMKGNVCAFVFGASTRNQAERFLAQATAAASSSGTSY